MDVLNYNSVETLPGYAARADFTFHSIIIRFHGWQGVHPEIPFIQLTTLDEHTDAKQVKLPNANDNGKTDND